MNAVDASEHYEAGANGQSLRIASNSCSRISSDRRLTLPRLMQSLPHRY